MREKLTYRDLFEITYIGYYCSAGKMEEYNRALGKYAILKKILEENDLVERVTK